MEHFYINIMPMVFTIILGSRPVNTPRGPLFNPALVSGVCGLLVGVGIGIGFGALIFHPFNSGNIGGGVWFGKRRKKNCTMTQWIHLLKKA